MPATGDTSPGRRQPTHELAEALREKINTGEWIEGVKLPTSRDLAAEHDVALGSVVRAVAALRDEGLIVTTHGQGSYVRARQEIHRPDARRYRAGEPDGLSPNRDEASRAGYWDEIDLWERWTEPATPVIAQRLAIEPGDDVSAVLYRFRVGAHPTQLAIQYEPLAVTRGTSAELPSSGERGQPSGATRMRQIGWAISHVSEQYRARRPTSREQQLLELPDGTPVLEITRISTAINQSDGQQRPVETATIAARGDRMVIDSSTEVSPSPNQEGSP